MARSAMRWRCATPNRRLLLPPLLPHRVCMHRRVHAHRCTLIVLSLIDYTVVALCVCVGSPLMLRGESCVQFVDSSGSPVCAGCRTRLSRCKGKVRGQPPHQLCQNCFDKARRTPSVSAAAAGGDAAVQSRKRRAMSDPGERSHRRAPTLTLRVTLAPPTASTQYQARTRHQQHKIDHDAAVMRLLDETHARRMDAIAAATALATAPQA